MSITRKNHYVPQWYQERFFADGRTTLFYLDMSPPIFTRKDGSTTTGRALFEAPTSRAFVKQDLYSTFFGTTVNDEIERRLFGDIDGRGADAIRAFTGLDQSAWHSNFETFFEYIDVQKLRTPKGLDWLKKQYPELSQNELMLEMQGIRFLNCTIWTTGVREIVSAEKATVKFIVTDHPVTIYNHAIPPSDRRCIHPDDPAIALKGSQTIFTLGPEHCLILSNLEYAEKPDVNPLENRTFARNYRPTMVSTIDFIRSRELDDKQVSEINFILKSRAQRHIAAGREAWLYPERIVKKSWKELRETLRPPLNELHRFGGEIYASYDSGHVHYQDEFGRSEKTRTFLQKELPSSRLKPKDACGCGSGVSFGRCCGPKAVELRPSWTERSIRERNLMLFRALSNLFELDSKDWTKVRRELTDDKIATAYSLYEGLWPLETDLLELLPKPDGQLRSVYTGSLHPQHIHEFAIGSALYFGEILIQHPFVHPGTLNKQFRPTEHPHKYRAEFLKAMLFFISVMPLVEAGLVNLIPDPCNFDFHLRDQMMWMARERSASLKLNISDDPRIEELLRQDYKRTLLALPEEALRKQMAKGMLPGEAVNLDELMLHIGQIREDDPLVVLQDGTLEPGTGGQFQLMKMAPNFEIAMYLAQATGALILTDSKHRWLELNAALHRRFMGTSPALQALGVEVRSAPLAFPAWWQDILRFSEMPDFIEFRSVIRSTFNYLKALTAEGAKPNFEAQLAARFSRRKTGTHRIIQRAGVAHSLGRLQLVMRIGGIQDNTINRLLLMSSSKRHLSGVPMALFIDRPDTAIG
ncbi:DUF4238 domain-containing protein [Sinorhizobium meliloti]|uniref:DUF4238 domain-containing protein n=1 Tax=Rhizobium meliloti TaxID=382 RepID=UPI003D64AB54